MSKSYLLSSCFQTFLPLSFLNVHIQSTHHINTGQLQPNQNVNELFIFCNTKYRKKLIYHNGLLSSISITICVPALPFLGFWDCPYTAHRHMPPIYRKNLSLSNMLMKFLVHIQTISRNIQNLNTMLFFWITEVCLLIYMYLGSNSFATRLALFHSSAAINMSMASLIRSTFRYSSAAYSQKQNQFNKVHVLQNETKLLNKTLGNRFI